ncbi:MAG: hypothetical protein CM15mP29_1520 [Alphaproteobacteria bacterium]|nr:MAG: hypothetical protein CM15mP29_1520 [Alphaproteobacteria bacterium]
MVISNQWVNSYKRIAADNESPSHISWSNIPNNFNAITIPQIRKGSEDSSRIEFRIPDPVEPIPYFCCNNYCRPQRYEKKI